ncbi:MAG TPA: hypothetical protein PK323_07450 [Bacteroidia bacterium]|nr:hypothetical protein [Bacteroidia bacterium]
MKIELLDLVGLYESEMVFRPFQTEVNADDHLLDQIYLVYYKYHIGIIPDIENVIIFLKN